MLIAKKTYTQTPSKIRTLWSIALQLIAAFENFDRKLTALEKKFDDISARLTSTIEGL